MWWSLQRFNALLKVTSSKVVHAVQWLKDYLSVSFIQCERSCRSYSSSRVKRTNVVLYAAAWAECCSALLYSTLRLSCAACSSGGICPAPPPASLQRLPDFLLINFQGVREEVLLEMHDDILELQICSPSFSFTQAPVLQHSFAASMYMH